MFRVTNLRGSTVLPEKHGWVGGWGAKGYATNVYMGKITRGEPLFFFQDQRKEKN